MHGSCLLYIYHRERLRLQAFYFSANGLPANHSLLLPGLTGREYPMANVSATGVALPFSERVKDNQSIHRKYQNVRVLHLQGMKEGHSGIHDDNRKRLSTGLPTIRPLPLPLMRGYLLLYGFPNPNSHARNLSDEFWENHRE